jgi:L-fuconolactonase
MLPITRRAMLQLTAAALAEKPMTYRILDPHVHVWKHQAELPFVAGAPVPDWDATPEALLALMKQHGIAKTVLIQVSYYLNDNRYLASVLKQYRQFFHGVCRVDPLDPSAPDQLSSLTEEDGFHGLRLSPRADATGDWMRGPLMAPLWKRCQELRVPMTLMMPITRVPDAAKLVDRFPALTVVIDHMADCPVDHPEQLEPLLALSRYPRVFVKVSHTWSLSHEAYPWMDAQQLVKRLHEKFGPERLMWATDWPMTQDRATYGQRRTVVQDEMKFLNANDKSWMLSKTIEQVWPFA